MKRLYYFADNIELADETIDDLHSAGIKDNRLHVMGRDKQTIIKHNLHTATPFQERDIGYFAMIGAGVGLVFGLCLIVVLHIAQIFLLNPITPFLLLGIMLLFTFLVSLSGAIYGFTTENHHITPFNEQLSTGQYLLLVDVVEPGAKSIKKRIERHKGIRQAGSESIFMPAFT